MSEQSITLFPVGKVNESWIVKNLTVIVDNEDGYRDITKKELKALSGALKTRVKWLSKNDYTSGEVSEELEVDHNVLNVDGWAYLENENKMQIGELDKVFNIETKKEIETDIDVEFSLLPVSSEDYEEDGEQMEEAVNFCELGDKEKKQITKCLENGGTSGSGTVSGEKYGIKYEWKVSK